MLNTLELCSFSPTGGTKKTAGILAAALSESVTAHDLLCSAALPAPVADVVLIAAPVYGGRIPAPVAEKVQQLSGAGKLAVTLVVYGNRAYEDALLELNDCAAAAGFTVVASGAFVAQHTFHSAVGAGRPDVQDAEELQAFAAEILAKLAAGDTASPSVPGNRPYKAVMAMPVSPIFLPECGACGKCMRLCPVGAISRDENGQLVTDAQKCILCMACVAACPHGARTLPPPLKATLEQKLAPLAAIRRSNERYL